MLNLDWEWSIFDPEQKKKKKRRETVFPQEREKAFEMGKTLAGPNLKCYTDE